MILAELLIALLIGFAIAAVFTYGLGRPGPWGGFLWLFLIIFLGAWAIGGLAEPVGPVAWGVAWVPILFGAILIALLIAAIPAPGPRLREPVEAEAADAAAAGIGLFFWILVIALLLIVLFGYWDWA